MAQFKYLGEPARSYVVSYGQTKKIAVPKQDGTKTVLENAAGFPVDEVIPFDFIDPMSLAAMRADSRFQEVV